MDPKRISNKRQDCVQQDNKMSDNFLKGDFQEEEKDTIDNVNQLDTTGYSLTNSCPNILLLSLKHQPHKPNIINIKKAIKSTDDILHKPVANSFITANGTKDYLGSNITTPRGILRNKSSIDIRHPDGYKPAFPNRTLEHRSSINRTLGHMCSIDIGNMKYVNSPKTKEIITLDPTKPSRLNELINSEIVSFNARSPSKCKSQYSDSWVATRELEDQKKEIDFVIGESHLPCLNSNTIKNVLGETTSCQDDLCTNSFLKRHSLCSQREHADSAAISLAVFLNDGKINPMAIRDDEKARSCADDISHFSTETQQLLRRKQMINDMADYQKPQKMSSFEDTSALNGDKCSKFEYLNKQAYPYESTFTSQQKAVPDLNIRYTELDTIPRSHSVNNLRCKTDDVIKKSNSFNGSSRLNAMIKNDKNLRVRFL